MATRQTSKRTTKPPAALADRQIVAILQHGTSITRKIVYDLICKIDGVCPDGMKHPRVDVWLESPGGDAHSAYKLAIFLRSRFDEINVVIPDYAKSAATLLVLGADNIYMGPCAELGPLDMQEAREGEMQLRSALDTAHSLESLFHRAITNALVEGAQVLQQTRLSRDKAVAHVLEFASEFYRPLIEQLDPVAIYAASTGLLVTVQYGRRLLQGSNPHVSIDVLEERVNTLVTGYPTHGFVIDRNEARESLGLPVKDICDYDMQAQIADLYQYQQENSTDIIHAGPLNDFDGSEDDNEGDGSNGETSNNGHGALSSRTPSRRQGQPGRDSAS